MDIATMLAESDEDEHRLHIVQNELAIFSILVQFDVILSVNLFTL